MRLRYFSKTNVSKYGVANRAVRLFLLLTVLLVTYPAPNHAHATENNDKLVVVLYSFNQDYPIQPQFTKGFQEQIGRQAGLKIRYSYESLDLPAYARDASYQENLAHFLRQKYRQNSPDVIVVQSKPATDFMLRHGKTAFGDIPVIVAAADQNGFRPEAFPANYTAVFGMFDIKKAAQIILDNKPATNKIYIILGHSKLEQNIQASFSEQLAAFSPTVEIIFLSHLTFPQMLESISNISGDAAILYTYTYSDIAGNTLIPAQALPAICAVASVPVYGILDTYYGTGAVGGYMASWEILGHRVAGVTGDILRGRRVNDIPPETYEATVYKFDWRQLQRFGISESNLPGGSIVEHKAASFWELHRWQILGAIVLIIAETILVIQLLRHRLRRKKAEKELRKLNAVLETKVLKRTEELQKTNAVLTAEATERQAAEAALRESRDEIILREKALKQYASELNETNNELKAFANIVAHDFRTPMVNIKGFSRELAYSLSELKQIIHDELPPMPANVRTKVDKLLDKDVPDTTQFIYSSVDRLDRIVEELLKLAREGRREMYCKATDLNELVDNLLKSYNHEIIQKDIKVEAGNLPVIVTDQVAMEQILGNLLDNAIKYLEPDRPGKIVLTCTETGEEYYFIIKDNGRGIVAHDTEKIFEIFRRSGDSGSTTGEGLGLAYVRKLVRQLGGEVWCESELGTGTAMHLVIPKRTKDVI